METLRNFLYEINVVKGLERPKNQKEYKRYHETIAYKDNTFKNQKATEIIIDYIKKNIKKLTVEDMGIIALQCPELISDIVKENNLGVEEITEICTSLQTNKAEELNAVLKNMRWKNWFKKRRFIKEAEKVAFEKMYIFERGEPKARLKAAIRVPQKVIKEDLHRRLKWISDPVDFLKSVKNPDVFFIKAFLNWNAEYGNIKRTCTEVQTFLNGRIRPLSEMAMDEIIEFMEERKRKEQEKEKKFFLEKKFPNEKSLTEIDETSKPPSELMQILPSILQHTH